MEMDLSKLPGKLADTVKEGLVHGLSDDQMVKGIVSLGNLADSFVKPDDPPEALVQAIWHNANRDEKEVLARIIVRMAKNQKH